VNRLDLEAGADFASDKVLLVSGDGKSLVGTPYVQGARVTGTIVEHLRGKKVLIFKHKRRKNYRRTRGHRQELTRIRIDNIETK
jgi:large subunit ribosomal protein L21